MSPRITALRLLVIGCSIPVLGWVLVSDRVWADQAKLIVRLKNGDHLSGALVAATDPKHIAIQCNEFERPLEFPVQAISSIETQEPDEADLGASDLLFVLANRTTLKGTLQGLTADEVQIQSRSLGAITLPRNVISEIVNTTGSGKRMFVGPRAGQPWTSPRKASAWRSEGGALVSNTAGVPVQCDVKLASRSEIRLALGWDQSPEFSMGLGVWTKKRQPTELRMPAFARLETWGKTLTITRGNGKEADFVALAELAESGRIALTIFIDHDEGSVVVCTPLGKVLGKLTMKPAEKPTVENLVELLNATRKNHALRLERIEVREWNGQLPLESSFQGTGIVAIDGTLSEGQVIGYDPTNQVLHLEAADKSSRQIPIAQVARVALATLSSEPSGDEIVEVQLRDESTCIGVLKSSQADQLELEVPGLSAPLACKFDQVLGLSGNAAKFEPDEDQLRVPVGSLESESLKLRGSLADSSQPGELNWLVLGTATPGTLSQRFSGSIVYPKSETALVAEPQVTQTRRVNGGILAQGVRMLFGVQQVAEVTVDEPVKEVKGLKGGLAFRSGDEVLAKVESIDEQGVIFQLGNDTKKIPHDKIESVTLVDHGTSHKPPPDKLKQLLTIPRAAKADPPTHLFVGANGDFLRGRLIGYAHNQVTAEIRLENVQFPKDAITQIYWLYSRQWDDDKNKPASEKDSPPPAEGQPAKPGQAANDRDATPSAESELLAVHAIQTGEKTITFTPMQTSIVELDEQSQQVLKGRNELLGDCQVRLSDVQKLLISRDIGGLVRQTKEDAWSLSVAALPKVYREGEASIESSSPLVGQPAPQFTLETVDGQSFSLADLRGRVIVLDFWASWCGPCMQTMPEVDRVVDEVGEGEVALVAVNVQESAQRAMAAVKRLQLTGTVVLDAEGEVSAKYEASAIPQTVIIDRYGKVTHVFVGGGNRFVEEFRAALTSAVNALD